VQNVAGTPPVAGPHRPRGDANLAFAITVVKSSCRFRFSTPRFFPNRISRWLHHIHPIHCHHTVPTHLRNRPICLVQAKIARDAHRLLALQSRSGRSQSRSSRFTLQFRWRGAPPAAKSLGNSRIGSPGLTPSGRVDAVRGGSSFVAAHWGDQAPDAVGDGCSGNFGLRRRHVGPLTTGTATGHSPRTGIRR
jgi:hypothetical protein